MQIHVSKNVPGAVLEMYQKIHHIFHNSLSWHFGKLLNKESHFLGALLLTGFNINPGMNK